MKPSKHLRFGIAALSLAAITFSLTLSSQAQTENVLYSFGGYTGDGNTPAGTLIFDHAGNLYGTTIEGGLNINCDPFGCGTVFELSPAAGGGWTETILYRFNGKTDGAYPYGALVMDAAGNLYGTTSEGGGTCSLTGNGCGTVFELSPTSSGVWNETILYNFTGGLDGASPLGALIFDAAGNLYGTTQQGGHTFGFYTTGGVFQLVPNGTGGWTENSIYTFHGADGAEAASTLVFDSAGNLYGTTEIGGPTTICSTGCGVVFKLTPTSSGQWTGTVIHDFDKQNGYKPYAGLTFDAAGNLYGTTLYGGVLGLCIKQGCGTVFELSPTAKGGWGQTRIFKFELSNGYSPYAGVIVDASGNVYGVTQQGGNLTTCGSKYGCGVAYKLTPTATAWTQTVLHTFETTTTDGDDPFGGLTFDGSGNLYGTTAFGGYLVNLSAFGTVFEITP